MSRRGRDALIAELREQVAQANREANVANRVYFEPSWEAFRVPVLAIVLMLENRLDAREVSEFSHVRQGLAEQARVERMRSRLGEISEAEQLAAVALWDETAS